jgi:NAD(P)-dependent dehydrogenase (short-subunit alcohol dehydrogenase family)
MCARTASKGHAAIRDIQSQHPQARVSLLEMDHESLTAVVDAAKHFLARESALHGLVNNAGIMATPYALTGDGFEAQWQTNYLAHWVFTAHLLPRMLQTSKGLPAGSVRVVNLSSAGHFFAPSGGINFADTALPTASPMTRYGQSKLGNVLHAKTLDRLYGPRSSAARAGDGEIWAAAVHPGLVDSQLGARAQFPPGLGTLFSVLGALGGRVDGDKGSWTSVFCVASWDMKSEQSGTYFQRVAEPGCQSGPAKCLELAERLEEWTQKTMGEGGWFV